VCGAGGGGYLLLAAPPVAHPAIRTALTEMGGEFASFTFTASGVRATQGDTVWAPTR
jgi:galactokinase/mevalonate kinase-like predicted kinase